MVKLYAGAFFPGIMLAALYIGYVIVLAKLKPSVAPPLSAAERHVDLPGFAENISTSISNNVLPGLIGALKGRRNADVSTRTLLQQLGIALLPALAFAIAMGISYRLVTSPEAAPVEIMEMGVGATDLDSESTSLNDGFGEPPAEGGLSEPPTEAAPAAKADAAEAPAALSLIHI